VGRDGAAGRVGAGASGPAVYCFYGYGGDGVRRGDARGESLCLVALGAVFRADVAAAAVCAVFSFWSRRRRVGRLGRWMACAGRQARAELARMGGGGGRGVRGSRGGAARGLRR